MTVRKPKADENLSKAIFTAAAAKAIATNPSTTDFEGLASYSFAAALAYAKVQEANKMPPINYGAVVGRGLS